MRTGPLLLASLLVLIAPALQACGTTEEAPEDVVPVKIPPRYSFVTSFDPASGGPIAKDLAGMQGSPVTTVDGDANLVEQYKGKHFQVVRVPQDDFCVYSLEGIFPNRDLAASDPASYNFNGIDKLVEGVRTAGADALWQASYDIGDPMDCGVVDGRHAGGPIEDPQKYVEVVTNVLRHFNQGEDGWDTRSGRRLNVHMVEFINDPMGLGGYDSIPDYLEHYELFARSIKAAFENKAGEVDVSVAAPAHRIRGLDETIPGAGGAKGFLLQFIDYVSGTGVPLDMLTVQIRSDDPFSSAKALSNLRAYMDRLDNLSDVPIWVTEVAPTEDTDARLREVGQAVHSAFIGAHLAAMKIAWQESVERTFPHRGGSRYLGPLGGGGVLESPFFGPDGADRLATLPLTAMLIIRNHRILRGSAVTSDGVAMLAVRREEANCPASAQEQGCMWLLIANPGLGVVDEEAYRFQAIIEDIPSGISAMKWRYAEVGAASPATFQFTRQGTLNVDSGQALFEHELPTPSTIYLSLTW